MIDEQLRQELVVMRVEDLRVREELMRSGELGGAYVPRMEAVHEKTQLACGSSSSCTAGPPRTSPARTAPKPRG